MPSCPAQLICLPTCLYILIWTNWRWKKRAFCASCHECKTPSQRTSYRDENISALTVRLHNLSFWRTVHSLSTPVWWTDGKYCRTIQRTCLMSRDENSSLTNMINPLLGYYLAKAKRLIRPPSIVVSGLRFYRDSSSSDSDSDADCQSLTPKWPAARLSLRSKSTFKQKCLRLASERSVVR